MNIEDLDEGQRVQSSDRVDGAPCPGVVKVLDLDIGIVRVQWDGDDIARWVHPSDIAPVAA